VKNPYFVSGAPGIYDIDGIGTENLVKRTGRNTGNLLFISALRKVIRTERFEFGVRVQPAAVRAAHDGLVIPAANWLSSTSSWGGLARLIEATKLPCVMAGLGAQSFSFDEIPVLDPGTLRLVKVVSERCSSISVRGEFSARVLEHYGIKNVTITGCPSLLWGLRPVQIDKRDKEVRHVAVGGTRPNAEKEVFARHNLYRMGVVLSRFAKSRGFDYVAQAELPDIYFALGRDEDAQARHDAMGFLTRVYDEPDENALRAYLGTHVKVFFNVEDWVAYLKTRDLMIGTRLHGAVASLLAGTASLLVAHDTRTAEMARHLDLPMIESGAIRSAGDLNPQKIYDELDFDAFNRNQLRYYDRFIDFFESNGVAHNLSRKAVSEAVANPAA
jgi:hypothetical protein